MNSDIHTQLRAYSEYVESLRTTLTVEEILAEPVGPEPVRPLRHRKPPPYRRRWVVALTAALAVLLLVGGVAWFVRLASRDTAPVTTVPPAPTTTLSVTTTTAPELTTTVGTPTTTPSTTTSPVPTSPVPVESAESVDGTTLGTSFAVGNAPGDIKAGAGALWVDDQLEARLYRIDPITHDVTEIAYGRESGEGSQRTIVIGDSGPWVYDPVYGDAVRIDPDTHQLAFDWLFPGEGADGPFLYSIATGGGGVWAAGCKSPACSGEQVIRLDPLTGAVIAEVDLDAELWGPLLVTDESVWTVVWRDVRPPDVNFALVRIDIAGNEVVAEIELPNVRPGFYFNDQIIAGGGYIFLTGHGCDCPDDQDLLGPAGRIVRIDPATNTITTASVEAVTEDIAFWDLDFGGGWLWGVRIVDQETREIVRFDPETLEIVGGSIQFDARPTAIDIALGGLWVSHGRDGLVTVIDLEDLP